MKNPSEYLEDLKRTFGFPGYGEENHDLGAIERAELCFARARWYYDWQTIIGIVAPLLKKGLHDEVEQIKSSGFVSETYRIRPIVYRTSKARVNLIRLRYPELFSELVHISHANAVKILGQKYVYNLARNVKGEEGIQKFEQINVESLRLRLTKDEADEVIERIERVTGWEVLRWDEMEDGDAGAGNAAGDVDGNAGAGNAAGGVDENAGAGNAAGDVDENAGAVDCGLMVEP